MPSKELGSLDDTTLPELVDEAFVALQAIMRVLVNERDQLVFSSEIVGGEIFLRVRVSKANELGKLIGKQGRIARSLRTLLYAMTAHHNFTVRLDIDQHCATTHVAR